METGKEVIVGIPRTARVNKDEMIKIFYAYWDLCQTVSGTVEALLIVGENKEAIDVEMEYNDEGTELILQCRAVDDDSAKKLTIIFGRLLSQAILKVFPDAAEPVKKNADQSAL